MGKKSQKQDRTTRGEAVRLRQEAEQAKRRRERLVRFGLGAGVLALAAGIIGAAALAAGQNPAIPSNPAAAEENPDAALPKGVFPSGGPFAYGVPVGEPASTDAPSLQVWGDFQCPGCKGLEESNGAYIKGLGTSGKVRVVLRPTTFLDGNLGTDHSLNASAAWGCAIDQDKGLEYYSAVYTLQPARQGDGWTQDQLMQVGEQVGITGESLDAFRACVQAGTYKPWALNNTALFYSSGVQGTPTGVINEEDIIPVDVLANPEALAKALFGTRSAEIE
jgi:protein-disulfide isomerase